MYCKLALISTLYLKRVYTCFLIPIFTLYRRGAVRLGMSKMTQVDFIPKEMVSYSKETQTPTEALTDTNQKAGKT